MPWRFGSARHSRDSLLRLITRYFGRDKVDAIGADMVLGDRDFRLPPKVLCILFASRAGSNYSGSLLANTPWFENIGESFHPGQLAAVREREGLADDAAAAQWMIDTRGTAHAFGFKAGFSVLAGAAQVGLLPAMIDRTQFVLLRRRDRVAQAVSLFKGKLNGHYHSRQQAGRAITVDEYDRLHIGLHLEHIERRERDLESFVRQLGKSAPIVHYEDICAAPDRFVADICALMDLDAPARVDTRVDFKVMRDELSHAWAERFRAGE